MEVHAHLRVIGLAIDTDVQGLVYVVVVDVVRAHSERYLLLHIYILWSYWLHWFSTVLARWCWRSKVCLKQDPLRDREGLVTYELLHYTRVKEASATQLNGLLVAQFVLSVLTDRVF